MNPEINHENIQNLIKATSREWYPAGYIIKRILKIPDTQNDTILIFIFWQFMNLQVDLAYKLIRALAIQLQST